MVSHIPFIWYIGTWSNNNGTWPWPRVYRTFITRPISTYFGWTLYVISLLFTHIHTQMFRVLCEYVRSAYGITNMIAGAILKAMHKSAIQFVLICALHGHINSHIHKVIHALGKWQEGWPNYKKLFHIFLKELCHKLSQMLQYDFHPWNSIKRTLALSQFWNMTNGRLQMALLQSLHP